MDYLEEECSMSSLYQLNSNFCREPHVNPKMDDGKDNAIFSLEGTLLTLEVIEVRATDEEEWYNVRLVIEDQDITGW
jgi:hypothetical protein